MEATHIIISCLISIYIGYIIGKGINNNHRELFQAYMDEQIKLSKEKHYYQNKYQELRNNLERNKDKI